jgi:L-amino acid N-acyltransferase YncA
MQTRTLNDVKFSLATTEDVAELAGLVARFYNESGYKNYAEFDLEQAEAYGSLVIDKGAVPHIVARKSDELVGFISYSLDTSGWVKPIAVMHMFYVIPECRRSPLGRALLALAVDMAKGDGACALHAPVASGTKAVGSLKNLFSKIGFEPCGYLMRKVYQ